VSETPPVKLAGENCHAEGVAGIKGAVRGRKLQFVNKILDSLAPFGS